MAHPGTLGEGAPLLLDQEPPALLSPPRPGWGSRGQQAWASPQAGMLLPAALPKEGWGPRCTDLPEWGSLCLPLVPPTPSLYNPLTQLLPWEAGKTMPCGPPTPACLQGWGQRGQWVPPFSQSRTRSLSLIYYNGQV